MASETIDLLQRNEPMLIVFSRGDDLRNEFSIALKKAEGETQDIAFVKINPAEHPELAERFNIGSKAVLLAYANGREIVRRTRPWGTDVPLAIEMLREAMPKAPIIKSAPKNNKKENPHVDTAPVHVTDQTFQEEVIDYELPVLVDFWADWCGPCKMVAPILDKLAEEYAGKVRIAKVDVDANPGLAQTFQVMSIPTIMMLKERHIVFSQPGALPEAAFRDLLDQLVELEIPEEGEEAEETPE